MPFMRFMALVKRHSMHFAEWLPTGGHDPQGRFQAPVAPRAFGAGQRTGERLRFGQMILALMEPSGLIEQGGPLVWVLLGLAFIGSVCVVERLFFFHRARINVKLVSEVGVGTVAAGVAKGPCKAPSRRLTARSWWSSLLRRATRAGCRPEG